MKVVIGAGKTQYEGWINTQETELNLLNRADFERMFSKEKPTYDIRRWYNCCKELF